MNRKQECGLVAGEKVRPGVGRNKTYSHAREGKLPPQSARWCRQRTHAVTSAAVHNVLIIAFYLNQRNPLVFNLWFYLHRKRTSARLICFSQVSPASFARPTKIMTEAERQHRFHIILAFGLVYLFWGSTYLA